MHIPGPFLLEQTKLHKPRLALPLVNRPRLLERLTRGMDGKVILISAPTGFGKTTLACKWLDTIDRPYAWLSLDAGDDTVVTFLQYLCAALQHIVPTAADTLSALLQAPQMPPISQVITRLTNDLAGLPHDFILVLDDYHTVCDPGVTEFMDQLIRRMPAQMHLMIVTRVDPPLVLARLRAQGRLTELRAANLRFTVDEVRLFTDSLLDDPATDEMVDRLTELSEGWIAVLRLAAIALHDTPDPAGAMHRIERTIAPQVMSLLVEEVLSQQNSALQTFLLQTSILNRFCASLCDAVVNDASQEVLIWLNRSNLFLEPLDDRGHWYRYHHLFQMLLHDRLVATCDADTIAALHGRASAWFAQHGYVDEAIDHALQAGNEDAAVRLIVQYGHRAVLSEEWQQLNRWLQRLPAETVDTSPELLLLLMWQLEHRWQYGDVLSILERLDGMEMPAALPDHVRGEIDFRSSERCYYDADGRRAVECAQRALARTTREHRAVRARARQYLAAGLQMVGDGAGARKALYAALQEDRDGTDASSYYLYRALGLILWMDGDLHEMVAVVRHLSSQAQQHGWVQGRTWADYLLGTIAYARDDLATAERHFAMVRENRYVGDDEPVVQSAFALALIYQSRGLVEKANEMAEWVAGFMLERGNAARIPVVRAFQAHLALLQGRMAEADQGAAYISTDTPLAPTFTFYVPELTLARTYIAQGAGQPASDLLTQLNEFYANVHNAPILIDVLALQALVLDGQGKRALALAHLERAMRLAEPGGFVRNFVDIGAPLAELVHTLARRDGATHYRRRLLAAFAEAYPEGTQTARARIAAQEALIEPLTERELEVLDLLHERLTNKEIARRLTISPLTVKKHVSNICQKLNAPNRRTAVARSEALGLLPAGVNRSAGVFQRVPV